MTNFMPRATLRRLGAPVLTVCLLPGWLAAQQPPDSTARPIAPRPAPLSELVVTATRTTRRIDQVPANVTVLSRATGMTLDELRDTCWPTFREDGRIRLEDILDYQRWARAHELLDTVATPAQLYDSSFAVASDRLMKPGRN